MFVTTVLNQVDSLVEVHSVEVSLKSIQRFRRYVDDRHPHKQTHPPPRPSAELQSFIFNLQLLLILNTQIRKNC